MIKHQQTTGRGGFSLAEVMVAVGVFAFSIVGIIGLLGTTGRSVSDVAEADDVGRVITMVQNYLQQNGVLEAGGTNQDFYVSGGNKTLAIKATSADKAQSGLVDELSRNYYCFYANREGTKFAKYNQVDTWAYPGEKYFEVIVVPNDSINGSSGTWDKNETTLGDRGFFAYTIRLRWPAYQTGPQRTPSGLAPYGGGTLKGEQLTQNNAAKHTFYAQGAIHR
jgi:type II secretory pathway pseudopilin PulG